MAVPKAISYFYEYYVSPGFGKGKYILPSHVNFPITDNCNSQCQMCNVWKDKSENELTPREIKDIFSDTLFRKVNHLGISGGEPTLRNDLVDCVVSILDALPKLKSLSITSHGFHPTKWNRLLPQIMELCHMRNVFFKLNISVDGVGALHEEVRRIDGGWEKVVKTIEIAKSNNCPLQIQCTVSKHNIFGVNEVLHFARKNDIEVIFRKATSINRLYNKEITDEFFTGNHEDSFFSDFLKSDSLKGETENPGRRLFYKDLSKRLVKGTNRDAPCHFQNNGVLISAHGEMFHCSIDETALGDCRKQSPMEIYYSADSRRQLDELLKNICPNCLHDQSGSWNPFEIIRDVFSTKLGIFDKLANYFSFGLKNLAFLLGSYGRKVKIVDNDPNKKTLHIIGAYGGEHVGDSAILGGAIIRQIQRHPLISDIVVYSKRADRTQFWINGLDFDFDVNISVKDYGSLNRIEVSRDDLLIWAGGPIMEMPLDLFEHYATIKAFTLKKIRFEVVGCGWGPFKTKYSSYFAKKILSKASYVQMRDKYQLPVAHELARDPAFDYLFTQKEKEAPDWNWNFHKSEEFIKSIKDKGFQKLLLLNLRPLWSKYNKSGLSIDELHRKVKDGIMEAIRVTPREVAIVSVPFNTDHYGFSDMDLAMEIKDICDNGGIENYFLFNRELNARDKIAFLRNFDFGICMRFHACIFLKSLDIPVFGIDYTAGEIGKVGGLFKSFNDPNYTNILNMDVKKINTFIEEPLKEYIVE